jgi:peptidoglycan hydrolase-like protein with peptidoglycan-binding domain
MSTAGGDNTLSQEEIKRMARSQVQYGSQGNDVKELQKILNQNGYKLTEDGIFGSNTQKAVQDYQKKYGLTVDGIVGTNTWGSLLGGSTPTTPSTNTTPTNNGFKYDDFSYDDFNYDKTFTDNGFNYDKTFEDKGFTYDKTFEDKGFSYDDYQESDIVTQAKDALNAQLSQKPGEYNSQWQAQLDDTINKILNREKFSYDLNGDALYQQYKDKYIQQGKMAMEDAIGQASAMTGGYGNSYAQTVGQQQYNAQLQNLNDIVPELYQMAYDKYNQEGQDLYNQYAMLGAQEEQDYGRHRDSVSDWQAERDYLTGRYDTERDLDYSKYVDNRNFAYGKYADDRNFAYGQYMDDKNFAYGQYSDDRNLAYNEYRNAIADQQWQDSFDYQKGRDQVADKQWQDSFDYQKGRDQVADKQWQDAFDYQKAQDQIANKQWQDSFDYQKSESATNRVESNAKDFHTTGGKVGYNNGSVSTDNIKLMQQALGVSADGKWGAGSTEAAGGLTADQAWKAYQDGKLGKPDISYDDVKDDCDYFISQGAEKSEIGNYLREALHNDYITQEEYNELAKIYIPKGQVYGTGGAGGTAGGGLMQTYK